MRKIKPVLGILTASVLWSFSAYAADSNIPRYDVKQYCQSVSDVSGGSSTILNGCFKMEQRAYNYLKEKWSIIPAKTVSYCDEVARTAGGSYTIFKGCIQMEERSAKSNNDFDFQY